MEALRQASRDRYEILEQVGQGSMGVVYRARDRETGDEVALKILDDAGSFDDTDLKRMRRLFVNEASAGSLVSHPGIVRIRDVGEGPGAAEIFLVMDYVAGSSLAEILARPDPLPFDFVVQVIAGVAGALDHVHAHGVVHRDIKPANILIGPGDDVRVTDFGLSELRDEDLAAELRRAGSPNYMAPERVLGTGCDYRGDIWALGVVLYEMLTRRLPFQGESVAELVTRIASEEAAPLDSHGMSVIAGLAPIVDRALAKEPEDRYQFAGHLAQDLKSVQLSQMQLSATLPAESIPEVSGEPEAAEASEGAPSWPARILSLVPRRLPSRRLVGLLAAASLALVGVWLTAGVVGRDRASTETLAPDAVERQRFAYLGLLKEAQEKLEEGESRAAAELFARAEALSPDAGRIRALREEARRRAEDEIAAEVDLEVAGLIGIGEADLAAGRLSAAEDAALRALEVDPRSGEAHSLAAAVDTARRVARARVERERYEAFLALRPPPPEPEPVEKLRVEQPIRPPTAAPIADYSDLKVDFYSEQPRGVLTVYRAESQILRRPFRFVERKGFMRSKGVSGGFDEQVRVKAGPTDFRIYLSLPGRQTQVRRLSGILPPGAIRALQVRVTPDGALSVALH